MDRAGAATAAADEGDLNRIALGGMYRGQCAQGQRRSHGQAACSLDHFAARRTAAGVAHGSTFRYCASGGRSFVTPSSKTDLPPESIVQSEKSQIIRVVAVKEARQPALVV